MKGFLHRAHALCVDNKVPTELIPEITSPYPPWRIDNISRCEDLYSIKKSNVETRQFWNILERHSRQHEQAICMFPYGSKTNAKMYVTVWTNEVQNMRRAPIVIHTDSRNAIQSTVSLTSLKRLVQLIQNRLAVSGRSTTFCWVPSHTGVLENERVDVAAIEATSGRRVRWVEVTRGDVKAYCKRVMTERRRLKWEAVAGNKYRKITDSVRPLPMATCSRDVILARLRIGHTTLTHKKLMEGRPQPYCENCIVPQTVKHNISWQSVRHIRRRGGDALDLGHTQCRICSTDCSC